MADSTTAPQGNPGDILNFLFLGQKQKAMCPESQVHPILLH